MDESILVYTFLLQVFCPKEYADWLQTMYVLFGTKFSKIFCGPMWSYDVTNQSEMICTQLDCQDPLQVLCACMHTY